MSEKKGKLIIEYSQIALIVSILLMIVFAPIYWNAPFASYFNFLFFSLIMISAIITLKKSGTVFKAVGRAGYAIIIL